MLRVDPVPSLGDRQLGCAQESPYIFEYELIDFLFVEDVDRKPVFVRIAERERAIRGLRNQYVDRPTIVIRHLARDARLVPGQRLGADFKRRIEPQREPRGKRRSQLPSAWLRRRSHHLKFTARYPAPREELRIERFEIVAAAYDCVLGAPGFAARFDLRKLNRLHRRSESELHAELLGQITRNRRDYLPRVERQLGVAPDCSDQAVRDQRVALRE